MQARFDELLEDPCEPPRHPADLFGLEGTILYGRYRVLRLVHAGPRCLVYEVEPPGVGTSRRALKVLTTPEGRDPEAIERLATHVEVARGIGHTDLERVYSFGRLADETPFLVTEWVASGALSRAIQGGVRLPALVAQPLLLRISHAMAALHERGLCHGDIRADHVLWSGADLETVRVTDAGVAAAMGGPPAPNPQGAMAYRAPELWAQGSANAASDVYALAVLAYRLRTGRYPFSPDDERSAEAGVDPVARLEALHRHATPEAPETVMPDSDWPRAVDAVILQALAKSSGARFVHAGAFARALEEAAGAPTPPPELMQVGLSGRALEAAHQAALAAPDEPTLAPLTPSRWTTNAEGMMLSDHDPGFARQAAFAALVSAQENHEPEPELEDPGLPRWPWALAGAAGGLLAGLLTLL